MKEGRNALDRFNATLIRLDDVTQNLQKITKPLADRSDAVSRNLDESLARLNRTLADVDQLIQAVGQSDGTLNKLLTDPSLYNHLDDVACQAAKAAPQLNLILKDVETFTDKLARHPELIGIGGAVRPSSGLKDPPTRAGAGHPADASVTTRGEKPCRASRFRKRSLVWRTSSAYSAPARRWSSWNTTGRWRD